MPVIIRNLCGLL